MKRRDFILGSASTAGVLIPGMAWAAEPCPPPRVSLSGGTSVTTNCVITPGSSYSTNFPGAENPLSEGGKWINGKAVGLDWNNVQSVPGKAFAAAFTGSPTRYSDPIAVLNTAFTANQFAQGTVSRVAGYSPPDQHEVELLLRFQITARNARGYEVLWGVTGGLAIVRWNGPVGNYTELASTNIGAAVDGDVLRAEIIGGVIRVYKNGSLVVTGPSNSTWTDGQPGIGFWPLPGTTLASYGWKNFQAGNR
jgi:hypothetical protein